MIIVLDSKREDLKKYSCFAIGISSHGVERTENAISYHAIEMFDHGYLYTKDVIDYFCERKCAALRNKPKLFLIQVTHQTIVRSPVEIS